MRRNLDEGPQEQKKERETKKSKYSTKNYMHATFLLHLAKDDIILDIKKQEYWRKTE